jgi:3',5'-cyclic AMP phosphodiesterase CpdA
MRTVVHISDLHFGASDDELVASLRDCIIRLSPSVVAVSGDLTQRARAEQFAAASRFLRSLPHPQVVVPGNHDVPLYNVLSRFQNPLGRFRRQITRDRFPCFADSEVAIVGADTTRSFTFKDGGLRPGDVRHIIGLLDGFDRDVLKIVVCHHPFDPLVGRSAHLTFPAPDATAIATLIEHGAAIFLTGHRHLSYAGDSAIRYRLRGRSAIVVEAGTATSTRARGEPNSFNVLRIDRGTVAVDRLAWDDRKGEFVSAQVNAFARSDQGWSPPNGTPAAARGDIT